MNDLGQSGRPIYWNVAPLWLVYVCLAVTFAIFGYGIYRRIQYWRRGRPDGERLADWGRRLVMLVRELLLQERVRGSRFAGLFHSLFFYSFVVLLTTTAVETLDADLGTHLMTGYLYALLSVGCEVGGVLILVGIGMALYRRHRARPKSLIHTLGDDLALVFLAGIILTGFLVEGLRIAVRGDPWVALSFVGALASAPFRALSPALSPEVGRVLHLALWWTHALLAFAWIAMLPSTKFFHLLALPTNAFFARLKPRGELARFDVLALMERYDVDPESFHIGIEKAADFTWKQRLDFDACISCGRCEEVCPAHGAGHPFSPREFIAGCREEARVADHENGAARALVGGKFEEHYVWYCRTCTACMEVCPANIDHVDTLIDIRRNEAMIQGRIPSDAGRAIRLLETGGNPFAPQSERTDWIRDLGVRVVRAGEHCNVLYWVGCCTTFDPTKRKIASDLCHLLEKCGIDFGVLGEDERCCGDPARLLGDERIFQEIARSQVEELKKRRFDILLVSCPHCYNVLKNEYPQFGGHFHVVHHSEFLHEMIWGKEIEPHLQLARRAVYHDPCYLGRFAKVFDAPRAVLHAIPGVSVAEMADSREHSRCCGGGGGHFWMDLRHGKQHANLKRVGEIRVEQARAAGADTIVTACAYCKQMLDDSVKNMNLEDEVEVVDIVSLVLRSLRSPKVDQMEGAADADGASTGLSSG